MTRPRPRLSHLTLEELVDLPARALDARDKKIRAELATGTTAYALAKRIPLTAVQIRRIAAGDRSPKDTPNE